jgi:hypothetical protein
VRGAPSSQPSSRPSAVAFTRDPQTAETVAAPIAAARGCARQPADRPRYPSATIVETEQGIYALAGVLDAVQQPSVTSEIAAMSYRLMLAVMAAS